MRRLSRRSSVGLQAAKADPLRQPAFPFLISIRKTIRVFGGAVHAPATCMHGPEKRIVYILRSGSDSSRHYVGITNDVADRLAWHNHGPCGHTIANRPWSLVVTMEFSCERDARRFEKYLKSGSGRAFASRHLGPMATLQNT